MISTKTSSVQRVSSPANAPFGFRPRRIGLVARDWRLDVRGQKLSHHECGYAPYLHKILETCSNHHCDAVLFALWSHSEKHGGAIKPKRLLAVAASCKTVILGVIPQPWKNERVFVLNQEGQTHSELAQCFSRSNSPTAKRRAFIEEIDARCFGKTLVLLCGESNIIQTMRGTKKIRDDFKFQPLLKKRDVEVILNPLHTYMRRYEMPLKRRALSAGGRSMISAWNAGDSNAEAADPWQHWHDRSDRSHLIQELPEPVPHVPGIRIGIAEVPA